MSAFLGAILNLNNLAIDHHQNLKTTRRGSTCTQSYKVIPRQIGLHDGKYLDIKPEHLISAKKLFQTTQNFNLPRKSKLYLHRKATVDKPKRKSIFSNEVLKQLEVKTTKKEKKKHKTLTSLLNVQGTSVLLSSRRESQSNLYNSYYSKK